LIDVNENWVNSDAFRLAHAQSGSLLDEAFKGRAKLESFEVILDTALP
jgi:hypothetical protein